VGAPTFSAEGPRRREGGGRNFFFSLRNGSFPMEVASGEASVVKGIRAVRRGELVHSRMQRQMRKRPATPLTMRKPTANFMMRLMPAEKGKRVTRHVGR